MCGYFCIGFIDFMIKGLSFLDCTNLCSPNDYEKNDKIITKIFLITKKMNKIYCTIFGKYRNFEKPNKSYLLQKT